MREKEITTRRAGTPRDRLNSAFDFLDGRPSRWCCRRGVAWRCTMAVDEEQDQEDTQDAEMIASLARSGDRETLLACQRAGVTIEMLEGSIVTRGEGVPVEVQAMREQREARQRARSAQKVRTAQSAMMDAQENESQRTERLEASRPKSSSSQGWLSGAASVGQLTPGITASWMMGPTSGAFAELKVASEAKRLRLLAARREAPDEEALDARRRQLDERTLMGRRSRQHMVEARRQRAVRTLERQEAAHERHYMGLMERERQAGEIREVLASKSEEALQRYDERRMQRERARSELRAVGVAHALRRQASYDSLRQADASRSLATLERISQVDERRTQTAQRRSYEAKLREERGRLKHLCARENYESILMAQGFKNEMMRHKCGKHIALERRGSCILRSHL